MEVLKCIKLTICEIASRENCDKHSLLNELFLIEIDGKVESI